MSLEENKEPIQTIVKDQAIETQAISEVMQTIYDRSSTRSVTDDLFNLFRSRNPKKNNRKKKRKKRPKKDLPEKGKCLK